MADMSSVGDMLSGVGSGALNVLIIIIVIAFSVGVVGASFWLYNRRKRYSEYTCIVWFRDGFGQLAQVHDQAGVFVDKKTRNKRFFMKKAKVGLSPDNIPFVMTTTGKRYVYLYRNGLKNFSFLKPNVSLDGISIKVGEEDVNWAVNDYFATKDMFALSSFLQYLPFISLIVVSVIILIIFVYFFKDFAVLKDVAVAMKEAAQAMSAANSNTTIIPV